MYIVYILKCADDTKYVGCTSDMEKRLKRHHNGHVHYTKSRLPVKILTTIHFKDRIKAYDFEKYLKTGSGRAFMNKRLI